MDVLKSIQWKHKENLRTVYNLFDHWNMALSSDFRHLKTLLATRLVFHLFWRWQPVAHAPFQQPRNAAVLKCCRPRTSDTAIWASLIVAGPYFLALLPARSLPFSIMLCCTTAWFKQLCGFASWPFSGSRYYIYCNLAYIGSISNRLIARKLERAKKKGGRGRGRGEEECLPVNPTILENPPWYFMVGFICKLTVHQNRTDYPWIPDL